MIILNICMNAPYTEGYSYQDNLLTEYQKKIGHDVVIITSTWTRNEHGEVIEIEPCDKYMDNGVRLIRVKTKNKAFRFLGIYPKVKKLIFSIKPDLIFIHGLCSFVPLQTIRYKRRNHNVCIVADNHQDEGTTKTSGVPFSLQLSMFRLCWKKWIRHVDKVYGTTSWRKQFAHKYYGIPYEKLDTLIMGIDSDRLPEDKKELRQTVRKELNLNEDNFMFVMGGKLDSRKCVIESINAFLSIKDPKAIFLIFGSVLEDIKAQFMDLIAKDERIIYIGYIPSNEVYRYFIASDFGVFPGRHSVLWEEAIGCGLPCLFKKYGDDDHMNVCENCVQLSLSTEEGIYEQMNAVLYDKQRYEVLKENAEKAAIQFSYHSIAKKSIECYKGEN